MVSERQVPDGIAKGKRNKEIAWELGISMRTVENRRSRMYRKLGVESVAALMEIAIAKKYAGAIDHEFA